MYFTYHFLFMGVSHMAPKLCQCFGYKGTSFWTYIVLMDLPMLFQPARWGRVFSTTSWMHLNSGLLVCWHCWIFSKSNYNLQNCIHTVLADFLCLCSKCFFKLDFVLNFLSQPLVAQRAFLQCESGLVAQAVVPDKAFSWQINSVSPNPCRTGDPASGFQAL